MAAVRRLAVSALGEVLLKGAKPRETLEPVSDGLEQRDRAFLMELVYGVLRYRDTLDWVLGKFLEKPGNLPAATLDNLRLGVYQIFYLRVPDWASVNEAVRLERRQRGLVNAVLRSVLRVRGELEAELGQMERGVMDASLGEDLRASYIATLTSHPLWLVRRWVRRFGVKEAYELALAGNRVAPLTLRVNTLRASTDEVAGRLRQMGMEAEHTKYSPVGLRLRGSHAFQELGGLRGLVVAQDEAAQLVALLLGPLPGERVLDACAAPGGKATHIAQMMGDEGEVVAVDRDEKRIRMLRENISSLGVKSVKVVHGDVVRLAETGRLGVFDRVLVDAPCSSTGVVRRHPDVKYRHHEGDLLRFREKQKEILSSASGLLRHGGVVVYSTCSTEPEEGEEVTGELLKSSKDFFIIKDAPFNGTFFSEGVFRTYPHRHDMDGFFCMRLGRKT